METFEHGLTPSTIPCRLDENSLGGKPARLSVKDVACKTAPTTAHMINNPSGGRRQGRGARKGVLKWGTETTAFLTRRGPRRRLPRDHFPPLVQHPNSRKHCVDPHAAIGDQCLRLQPAADQPGVRT
jgi:hypothetical protein